MMTHNTRKRLTIAAIALYFIAIAVALFAPPGARAQTVNNFVIPFESGLRHSAMTRPAPTWIDARVLAAGVNEAHTVPTGAKFVIFSSDCNFYARTAGAAAVPGADVTTGVGSELNPSAWYLQSGITTINLIASGPCVVTMAFYAGPTQ